MKGQSRRCAMRVAVLLLSLLGPAPAGANVIFSEDFSDVTSPDTVHFGGNEKWGDVTEYYLFPTDPRWDFLGTTAVLVVNPADGDQALALNEVPVHGIATVEITSFVPGQEYLLTFDHWGDDQPNTLPYEVDIHLDATLIGHLSRSYSSPGPGASESISFFATAASHDLTFTDVTFLGAASACLDNILISSVIPTELALDLVAGSECVQPGEQVQVLVRMENLGSSGLSGNAASGFQAFLAYNSSKLSFVSATYPAAPFGLHIITGASLNPSAGEIDLAAGIDQSGGQSPTTADATVATVTLQALSVVDCLGEAVTFRSHTPATAVTDILGGSASPLNLANSAGVVIDGVDPTAVCQNITVQLNPAGLASITAGDIDGGSSDNCAVPSLGVDIASFTCLDVGPNPVTLTVTDCAGNQGTCQATVTVEDNLDPVAICQNITVQLDPTGNATITGNDIDNGSSDACGIQTLAPSIASFTCADVALSPIAVTLTVTDVNGNQGQCLAQVTVEDNVVPVALCQDLTVQLDLTGNATITPAQVDNGSNDACGVQLLQLDVTSFTCADVALSPVTATLTVTDVNGNPSMCESQVTVEDNVDPVITCSSDVTVDADAGGCTTAAANVSLGTPIATDACGVQSVTSDAPAVFPQGATTVTWTATDVNGNVSTCEQEVIVTPFNRLDVAVELKGISQPTLTRCIVFELFACPSAVPLVVTTQLTFSGGVSVTPNIAIPCGNYTCITARDPKHSLRRTDADQFGVAPIVGTKYVASFADLSGGGGQDDALVNGDLNHDDFADILDFGIFTGQFGTSPGGNTPCGYSGPHAEISGNGSVFTEDFTFIGINFLEQSEADCCTLPLMAGPVTRISVQQLRAQGLFMAVAGDLNGDRWLDELDIAAFLAGARPQSPLGYVVPADGQWQDPANWPGGSLPGAETDVMITSAMGVGASGAMARDVTVGAKASLRIEGGSLFARSLSVLDGAVLALGGEASLLSVESLVLEPGAMLAWDGGTIEIAGGRVIQSAPDLVVGDSAVQSTLRLIGGAEAFIPRNVYVGVDLGDIGLVDVADGALYAGGAFFAGVEGEGRLDVGPGSLVAAGGNVRVGALGSVSGGDLDGGLESAGLVEPSGTLYVPGSYVQKAGAELLIRLPGALVVDGDVVLAGALRVETGNGWTPKEGDVFEVIVGHSNQEGAFDAMRLPAAPEGLVLEAIRSSRGVSIIVKTAPVPEPSAPRARVLRGKSSAQARSGVTEQ